MFDLLDQGLSPKRINNIAGQVDVRIIGVEDVREQILRENAEHVFQSWLASREVR